ncbi:MULTISPECIES: helix-turn-helix transcriptional regulator [unclassified Streptomyces]|uniref:helix-turn-helix domain-containing protein n=1 Tax=unclassified Streptomyces TaxID=2593676 RepID=UPI00190AC6FB|nr:MULTISPECIES: helix-turn-helix transcriptional regulator [unclassified Streptomyces]MBK3566563.1 helix-turn-helix transcriptional regulator [Streptomyces sp. MBT62]MBK6013476.1 helix-turn-helix transcriptional regulator [Streptomyces sp. MBT53]
MNSKKNRSTMRLLGSQVKAARMAAGLTQRQLAERAMVDEETIASIEQGRRRLMLSLAKTLDLILDTKGTLAAGVDNLPEIDQFPLYAEEYMLHEREAIALSWYDALVVPGLLQTEEYARALLSNRLPAYDEDELATKLAGRISRQEILHRKNPPTMSFVVWEPALLWPNGGREVHREQLRALREYSELPGLSLQILPLNRTSHVGDAGPFILLETPDHQHLAYTDSQRGSQWVSDPDEVSILTRRYAMLRTQALTIEDSRSLLDRLLGE